MILLGLIGAAIWCGIGALFGVQRARQYTHFENGHRAAIVVFLAYCILGVIGAAIWLLLYTIVIASHLAAAQAEQRTRRNSSSGGSFLALLVLLFVDQISQESIDALKQNGDEFVLRLALVTVVAFLVVGAIIRFGLS